MPEPATTVAPAIADADFSAWMTAIAERTERALDQVLPAPGTHPATLHEAMRYAVLGGGKRVRPLLVHAAGALVQADPAVLDLAGCAVELVHAYSLVHDDMPCMDDDALRRGKPTVHVAYGEANAMLVGDALQALAFEALARAAGAGAQAPAVVAMALELARAAGSVGMAGGQAIDLVSIGRPLDERTLRDMHHRKTGALLQASVLMGAACGTTTPAAWQSLSEYGDAIGLAFQVVDDILDVTADSATLGKTAGKDALADKPTYVSVLGLDRSRRYADDLLQAARAALLRARLVSFGGTRVAVPRGDVRALARPSPRQLRRRSSETVFRPVGGGV